MRRSTEKSAFLSLLKSGSAGAFALAAILACSDSTSPSVPEDGIPVLVEFIEGTFPDSVKQAAADQFAATLLSGPGAISASVFASPAAALSSLSSSCGSGGGPVEYVVSTIPFSPEPIPIYAPYPLTPDKWVPDVSIGFDFSFFGNAYDKVNVYSNGFLKFGTPTDGGYFLGGSIPDPSLPNNIIALAWSDWEPQGIPGAIRYETRGTAPNRRFLIQYNNVPEYKGQGLIMAQLILHEGSNDITMYTNTMFTTNPGARITQGIENADGTLAAVGPLVRNPVNGILSPRVRGVYKLKDDAIRFSLPRVTDTEAPSITAPANISDFPNDPGLGSAVVAAGSPVASDNCALESVTPSRNDGAAIDAPYPVGVTTITWTAKDASGNVATATQSITVIDVEDPIITFIPANFSVNATSSLGAFVSYAFTAWDNVAVTSLSCDPAMGSRLHIGVNPVTCSASDAAGHEVSRSFEVTVIDAPTQMMNLLEYVISRGMPEGMTNPLVNELQQAFADAGNSHGCKKMGDFIDMVEKKGVPGAWAEYMTSEALRIMTVMQCSEISKQRRSKLTSKKS